MIPLTGHPRFPHPAFSGSATIGIFRGSTCRQRAVAAVQQRVAERLIGLHRSYCLQRHVESRGCVGLPLRLYIRYLGTCRDSLEPSHLAYFPLYQYLPYSTFQACIAVSSEKTRGLHRSVGDYLTAVGCRLQLSLVLSFYTESGYISLTRYIKVCSGHAVYHQCSNL
jgi:hypothetical protein